MSASVERRSLEERLDAPAEAWKPEAGDKLIGEILDLDERESNYDDQPYPLVTVLSDDGEERAFHAFHTVARRELGRLRPRIGERIGIAYHGRHAKGYERYVIKLDRVPKSPNWDRVAAKAEAELAGTDAEPEDEESEPEDAAKEGDIPF